MSAENPNRDESGWRGRMRFVHNSDVNLSGRKPDQMVMVWNCFPAPLLQLPDNSPKASTAHRIGEPQIPAGQDLQSLHSWYTNWPADGQRQTGWTEMLRWFGSFLPAYERQECHLAEVFALLHKRSECQRGYDSHRPDLLKRYMAVQRKSC